MRPLPLRTGWLTGLAMVAVLALNVAGMWGIAVARRGALDENRRGFESAVAAHARSIENGLTAVRADLAFLANSSAVSRLSEADLGGAPSERRADAQNVVLLFLHAHPEVVRVAVHSADGTPLLHAGRRGGVPLIWLAPRPTGREGAAVAPGMLRPVTQVASGEKTVEMEIGVAQMMEPDDRRSCDLRDAGGRLLARDTPLAVTKQARTEAGADPVASAAELSAESWSVAAPWTLDCVEVPQPRAVLSDSVTMRYRTTLVLNLAVMALAVFLGGFAVQQARRRERLEAQAREEAKVRELERRLLHAERLTTVGRLAAGIAHEINNPLEGMANWLSLAGDAVRRGRTDEAEAHLARVKEGLDRAAGTVHQVLAHSDPAKAPTEDLDLNDVMRDTGSFIESRKEFRDIEFFFELSEGPLMVRGNATMLGQVAVNLILNACEAQPDGGEVRVRSRRQGDFAVAEVADRGPGVPEEDRLRIFEPFYSTKDSTGQGLSICHTIVTQHNGELVVLPRERGGTVMSMRLPAVSAEGGTT